MLDSKARKFVDPIIDLFASLLERYGFTADQVTMVSFITGLFSAVLVITGFSVSAIGALWISGFLDAADGALARKKGTSSNWGTLLDITSDRIVEVTVIVSLAYRTPEGSFPLILLLSAIIFSMTVFLTVGSLADKSSVKSFYYQSGLAERTEGFIMFSLMILFPQMMISLTFIFTLMIVFTGCQRLSEAKEIFKRSN